MLAGRLTQHIIASTKYNQQGTTDPLLKSIFAKQQQATTGNSNNFKKRHTPKILKLLDIAYAKVCTI